MTFEGMRAFEVAAIPVDGTIPCTPEALGVPDPAPGRTKHCYCAPTLALAPCADEFDVCSCDGTVVFGRRHRNRVEEHVSGAGPVAIIEKHSNFPKRTQIFRNVLNFPETYSNFPKRTQLPSHSQIHDT